MRAAGRVVKQEGRQGGGRAAAAPPPQPAQLASHLMHAPVCRTLLRHSRHPTQYACRVLQKLPACHGRWSRHQMAQPGDIGCQLAAILAINIAVGTLRCTWTGCLKHRNATNSPDWHFHS